MTDSLMFANGVNGHTGEYLFAPMDAADLAALVRGEKGDQEVNGLIGAILKKLKGGHLGLPLKIDASDPAQAGWGVVFSVDESTEVRAAIQPLIDHRIAQFGLDAVKVLDYQGTETWAEWLARHETAVGAMNPAKIPYYLLLVGSPAQIPYRFQYLLDVEYAVGRIHFDTTSDYVRYGESVIGVEEGQAAPRRRSAAFFATKHPNDRATKLSAERLVSPVAQGDPNADPSGVPETFGYAATVAMGPAATKEALGDLFAGRSEAGRQALLFTATHGVGGWPPGHEEQQAKHGALLCQDWPGIGRIDSSNYFAASDLPSNADVHGMVAFVFACYGAGTPEFDEFVLGSGEPAPVIADPPFVARLPKSMLAHQAGGAIAVIGHVERAWGHSFMSGPTSLLVPFENALARILKGDRIGLAMNDFNERYAALSASLTTVLHDISFGKKVPDSELASLWAERNDAQNFVLLGDPAVRLTVEAPAPS